MTTTAANATSATQAHPVQGLHITRAIDIAASPQIVWDTLLEQLGPRSGVDEGMPMPMKLEPWPGGRWYRDLGDNAGHLWGHVQVIKPPKLLEICGPLPMSYPAINHLQYRLAEQAGGTRLSLVHRAIGDIVEEHRDGMPEGWMHLLEAIKARAER